MLCECLLDTLRRGDPNDTSANYLLLNKNRRQIYQICHISVVLTNTKIIFFFFLKKKKKKNLFVSSKFGVSLVNRCSRRDFAIFFPNFRIFLIFLRYHIIIFHRKKCQQLSSNIAKSHIYLFYLRRVMGCTSPGHWHVEDISRSAADILSAVCCTSIA